MRAVFVIAGMELRRFLRDRSNLFFVFLFPILLVVLIGSQFSGGGPAGRVVMAGPDGDLHSQLVAELQASGTEVWFEDAASARDDLARGRADVGLFLTAEAEQAFDTSLPADVEVVTASPATAQAVLQQVRIAVQQVASARGQLTALTAGGLSDAEAEQALGQVEASDTPPRVEVTDVNRVSQELAGLGQFDLGASSQLLLFVFLSSLTGASTLILSRRQGVLARTIAAPVSISQALTGQALGRFVLAMVQGLYLILGTAFLFDVDWGNWPASLLVLITFAAVSSAAAMIIGSMMDNDGAATGVGVGVGLIIAALGGCMVPLDFFPDTMRTVAHITPHAWAYDAFAEIQRHDGHIRDVLPQLGVLSAMAVALLALGTWLLRRSLDRAL